MESKDIELLADLGYRQEFKRAFRPLEVFGLAFSVIGLFPAIASTLALSLPCGGPVALIWGWTVCGTFVMTVALSIAELSSAAPTAGGLYFWTFKYASPRWRYLLSWIAGYSNTMCGVAGMASGTWALAVQLMAAVSIGTNQEFIPTTGQIYALYVALFIVTAFAASFATQTVAYLERVYMALNILLCVAVIIALPISTPDEFKNPVSYVFGKFSNREHVLSALLHDINSGIKLSPLWVMSGYDAPVHMSEEASNAATAVPMAIVSALGCTAVLGLGLNIALAFNMGKNVESIMANPIGQPMATIFFNSFGTRGTLVVWTFIVLAQFSVCASYLVACSRQMFAFSRDGALPFSRYVYRMNTHTQTPVICVWAVTFLALLLGLLAFAGPNAINATFSLSVVGLYLTCGIPIGSRLLGPTTWIPGPFSLGKLSVPVAVVALVWCTFAIVIVMFPSMPDPTGLTMNYTVVVGGGWIGLCILYFYFPRYGGVHWFKGPMANISRDASDRDATLQIITESVTETKDEKYLQKAASSSGSSLRLGDTS
ncbi:hypothetical protein NM688_g3497 [Phlebia brevispora]|uniref:Uncharacterized protein n=1 Tax=Phlebia brevispora TaxID=194682 RepID=A0ACC1T5D1_9APHY|nr:hypothetical protein NM688_g3497 [Phlebia brevispora]